ncbi:hypothetical protein ABHB47_13585, partial [Flavonifractor plautii]|uniref:hypothetical protein n=1 Tax=Flavonifractor plautii TaxID=292800 RepID=UPI00232BE302
CRNFILPDICKPCLFVFLRNLFYLTQISYGNTTLEENVYLQGLRISGPSRKEAGLSNCGRRWPGAAGQGFSSL